MAGGVECRQNKQNHCAVHESFLPVGVSSVFCQIFFTVFLSGPLSSGNAETSGKVFLDFLFLKSSTAHEEPTISYSWKEREVDR